MKIKGIGLNTVELAVSCAYLWLSLIEIGLGTCLAIQLFYLIRANIEEITVIRFLVRSCKTAEDQDVLV